MTIEEQRKAFERFCTKDDKFCIHRYEGDPNYSDDYTQCAWLAWLASANQEGYKLVPVEPNYKQLDALKNSCELFKKAGVSDLEAHGAYKAMIGAQENNG